MRKLKSISKEAIPRALERAERYRLMKEPSVSESICLDILSVEPENQEALVMLLLSLSEQFKDRLMPVYEKSLKILERITDAYKKVFYEGIIYERRALSHFHKGTYGSGQQAFVWFRKAMDAYGKAIELRPPGNDDAILRWNNCVRTIERNHEICPPPDEPYEQMLE
jgi:hypothetical protein